MKVYFKEVGQGDSIILEWAHESQQRIAVIDANIKKGGANPALEHIKRVAPREIEFILLSHPHLDHFSGLNDILLYCESNGIAIKRFLHTAFQSPEYLRGCVTGNIANSQLDKLYRSIQRLTNAGTIEYEGYITDNSQSIELENDWILKFYAPGSRENHEFLSKRFRPNLEIKINSSAANYLSTLIVLYSKSKNQIGILSSDTMKNTFRRIVVKGRKGFDFPLRFAQVPHHGSIENFNIAFWRNHIKESQAPAVISTGDNDYGHPSSEVINRLFQWNYQIDYTNTPSRSFVATSISSDLDIVSSKSSSEHTGFSNPRDVVYTL